LNVLATEKIYGHFVKLFLTVHIITLPVTVTTSEYVCFSVSGITSQIKCRLSGCLSPRFCASRLSLLHRNSVSSLKLLSCINVKYWLLAISTLVLTVLMTKMLEIL